MLEIKSAEVQVYEALRAEIIEGLAPGAPLRLAELAGRYGVSTMPVRSAIRRLEADGLARPMGRRGHVVAPLALEDFLEVQAIRAALEGYAARLGAEAIDGQAVVRMRQMLEQLEAVPDHADLNEYLEVEHGYRDLCLEASGSMKLFELVRVWRRAADRYVRLAVASEQGARESIAFQRRLLAACERRDGTAAEAVTREALQWTVDRIVPRLRMRA
jgi:DNA-binding GntR family transcriptional regulator